jgi:undecaprenyl-diphosphatase
MAWGRWGQAQVSRPPRALISPRARPLSAAAVLGCAAVVIALGIRYAGHTAAGPLDARAGTWVQGRLGVTSPTLTALTWLGDPAEVALVTVAAVAGCVLRRWWRGAVLALVSAPVSSVLTEHVLKPLIGRTIGGALAGPDGRVLVPGGLSMPSGHTTAVFTLATLVAVLLLRRGHRVRGLIVAAAYLLAAAVGVAMIAQGFHYFTDVVSGIAVGAGTVLAGALVIDALAPPVRARARRAAGLHPRATPGPN